MNDGLICLGAVAVGDVFESILKAGGAVAESALAQKEAGDIASQSATQEQSLLNAALAIDVNSAASYAKDPRDANLQASAHAGARLSDASTQTRLAQAQRQLASAKTQTAKLAVPYWKNTVDAWTKIVGMIQSGGGAPTKSKDEAKKDKESWLTRRVLGPLPGYGVLAIAGGVVLVGAKIIFRKRG